MFPATRLRTANERRWGTGWRWAAVLAVAAGAVAACSDEGGGADAPTDIPPGSLLLPPEQAGDLKRTDLQLFEDDVPSRTESVFAVRVERADGGVVAALLHDRAELEDRREVPFSGDSPEPVIGLGRAIPGFSSLGTSVMWPATEDLVIELASRDLSEDQLLDVAAGVTLDANGSPVLPTEPIGEIRGPLRHPLPGTAASYAGTARDYVVTHAATPQVQDAYAALLIDRPEDDESVRTTPSCCSNAIYEPPRTLEVDDREAVAGSISPYLRVLIVPGEPGIVLVGSGALDDAYLAAIAAGAELATIDDIARVVRNEPAAETDRPVGTITTAETDRPVDTITAAVTDRLVEKITAAEQSSGYEVLHRWDDDDASAVLTFGTAARTEPDAPSGEQPTLCAVRAIEPYNPACLPAMPPDVVVASPRLIPGLRWGLVADGVEAVHYEFPEGEVATTITEVDVPGAGPTRVFHVLVTMEEEIELLGDISPEGLAATALVATDGAGRELARRPVFPSGP